MNDNNFNKKLDKYAQLIVEVGVNVQQSHTVVLQISVDQAPLARLITKKAYELKAAQVIVKWSDEIIQKEFLTHACFARLENIPQYRIDETEDWIAKKASRISVISEDPQSLADIDNKRIATYQKANGKALLKLRKATQANEGSWTVVAASGQKWAKRVFPDLSLQQAQAALWEEIFKTTRIDAKDPVTAWKKHDEKLAKKAAALTEEQFDALHYRAPGTDLTIGLAKNHLWEGAGSFNAQGEKFMANMPTEEVFTAPDSKRIDGEVVSTKPLSYAGTIIKNMKFTFKNGKLTSFSAEKGEDVLADLLATDNGATSLGEVALVPDPSPISQSGITFFNTLFDENASNHLALGSAYPFNIKDGTQMSDDELKAAGLNLSQTHVDFMIGSDQMDIDGIKKDGTIIPIFRKGDWA
ncbi:MAG TPA: aminopeptidase [Tetragenococcus sp.]|nr:aminopeptidase [Tetragenococcus sp.]